MASLGLGDLSPDEAWVSGVDAHAISDSCYYLVIDVPE